MDAAKFRSWVFARQGLEGRIYPTAREALVNAGWQRSVGGVNPYFAIRARSGEGREEVDALAASLQVFELPSARSCTYVVPADHFALALAAARNLSAATEITQAKKMGATDAEIDTLKEAVVEALADGPLSPADMKPVLGDKVRNFGEEGKKKGLTTSLPLALSLLQTDGRIRRKPVNGRFDVQRYNYELWNPPHTSQPSDEETAVMLARLFFHWMGAATLKEFKDFTVFNAKLTKFACDEAGLIPFDDSSDLLALPEAMEQYDSHAVPSAPVYQLISALDSYLLQRRGSRHWLADEDLTANPACERALKSVGDIAELLSHTIVDRGRLVGLWDYDQNEGKIEWGAWVKPDDALLAAMAEMETYVRDELGDARSFSLDSPASRKPRLDAIRRMAG